MSVSLREGLSRFFHGFVGGLLVFVVFLGRGLWMECSMCSRCGVGDGFEASRMLIF